MKNLNGPSANSPEPEDPGSNPASTPKQASNQSDARKVYPAHVTRAIMNTSRLELAAQVALGAVGVVGVGFGWAIATRGGELSGPGGWHIKANGR